MSRSRTGNKRERLISAAVDLFAEKGYYYTTTAEVSAHAGVAAGTLYLYFNSKDDLLLATLDTFLDEFSLNVMPSVYAGETSTERVENFTSGYLQFIEDHKELAQVFFVELRQNNMALRNAAGRVWDRYYAVVRDLVSEMRKDGIPGDSDIDDTVALILWPIELVATRWLLGHDHNPPTAHAASLTRIIATDAVTGTV